MAGQGIWPTGVPNLSALVRGASVYDPRTGTTGWTNNAALIAAHYLCDTDYGMSAVYADEIDEADLEDAADVCDERVSLRERTCAVTADAGTDILTLDQPQYAPITRTGVRFTTTGTLPAPLATGTTYYAIHRGRGRIQLATSDANARAGTAIDLTDTGSGTHTLVLWDEPRYTANGSFTVDATPRAVLAALAAAMAGRIVDANGKWHIHAGAYEAPTIELDEDDLAGPISLNTALSGRAQCNGVKGIYRSPGNHWQRDDFPAVDSATYLAADQDIRAWKDLDLTGFVVSRAQAQRLAKIELLSTRQGLTVELPCKLTAWKAMTGRTVGITNTRFGWSNKAFEVVGSRFTAGTDGALGVQLSLRETAAAIYDWTTDEESSEDIAPNTDLDFSVGDPGAPSATAELVTVRDGAGLGYRVTVSFAQADYDFGASYQLEYKLSSASAWTVLPLVRAAVGSTGDLSVIINDVPAGTYDFRVRAIGVDGKVSSYATTSNVDLSPNPGPPSDIANLSMTVSGNLAHLTWDEIEDADVRVGGYVRFRWSPETSGATWSSAVNIGPQVPGTATDVTLPLREGTYLAKAVDASGLRSDNAVSVITTEPSLVEMNSVTSVTEHPAWAGTMSNVALDYDTSAIQLDGTTLIDDMSDDVDDWGYIDSLGGVTGSGTYLFANTIDLGGVYLFRLRGKLKATSFDAVDFIDSRTGNIDDWDSLDGTVVDDSDAWMSVRTTDDEPSGSPSPTWTSWRRLVAGDYKARAMEFRLQLRTRDANHNVRVEQAIVYCDMADRVESDEDVASGAGAKAVTFAYPFQATPSIGITGQNMATGDYFEVTSKTTSGFTVTFKNSGGSAVNRTFDWTAKGYGRQSA